jgi:hypothetical protein
MSYSDFTQPPMNCCAAVNVAVGSNAPFCPAVCYFSLPPTADVALHRILTLWATKRRLPTLMDLRRRFMHKDGRI